MRARRTVNSDKVFRLPGGNEDNDLWVEVFEDDDGYPIIASVWEPTPQERLRIAAGENVKLMVWGSGHPPVAMGVTDERLGKPPATG